jgi:hypothetical protein
MRACLTTAPPLYSADDMIPDLAGEAAASPAAPDVTGNRSTPGTADCLVHAGEYQPTADHVTQDEEAQHHRLRADQHQVTARPPGLRPHCHDLVQGVAVHVGQFRQVNDYPCPAAASTVSAPTTSAAVHTSSSPRSAMITQPARALSSARIPGMALLSSLGSLRGLDTRLRLLAPAGNPTPGNPHRHPRQRSRIREEMIRRIRRSCLPVTSRGQRGQLAHDSLRALT